MQSSGGPGTAGGDGDEKTAENERGQQNNDYEKAKVETNRDIHGNQGWTSSSREIDERRRGLSNGSKHPHEYDDSSKYRDRLQPPHRGGEGKDVVSTTSSETANAAKGSGSSENSGSGRSRQQILEERAIKIRAARERYFKRREEDKGR